MEEDDSAFCVDGVEAPKKENSCVVEEESKVAEMGKRSTPRPPFICVAA
jgi:hypothetical protein